mmetsp:Transcript_57594/g.166714  ORF Transcript_57594/g.166714 Transcript_57594/m.166714 type:complete len:201 (-) Transcript_57594:6-608(-)
MQQAGELHQHEGPRKCKCGARAADQMADHRIRVHGAGARHEELRPEAQRDDGDHESSEPDASVPCDVLRESHPPPLAPLFLVGPLVSDSEGRVAGRASHQRLGIETVHSPLVQTAAVNVLHRPGALARRYQGIPLAVLAVQANAATYVLGSVQLHRRHWYFGHSPRRVVHAGRLDGNICGPASRVLARAGGLGGDGRAAR